MLYLKYNMQRRSIAKFFLEGGGPSPSAEECLGPDCSRLISLVASDLVDRVNYITVSYEQIQKLWGRQ